VCGWLNLRSHLAISFNQNQYKNVCVVLLWRVTYPNERWSYYDGWPTQMQDGLILTGDLPRCKMVSLWWVTYPSGEKGRVVSFLWVTYPGEEWPYYNGWPIQVKKDGEWSHSNGWPTQKMVSLWWVTYPSGKGEEWSHSYGWPTQGEEWPHYNGWPTQVKKKMENGLILTGDLPRKNGLIMMGDLPKWKGGRVVSFLWVTYPGGRMASL